MSNFNSLANNVPVPTSARKGVKAFILKQPGFAAIELGFGVPSRNFSKAQWFAAARQLGVEDQVLAMINAAWSAQGVLPAVGSVTDGVVTDDGIDTPETDSGDVAPVSGPVNAPHSIDSLLGDVRDFLSPKVVAALEAKLAPVVAAANKPQETRVEIQKIIETVTVDPGPKAGDEAHYVPFARKGEAMGLGKVFGVRGKHAQSPVNLWDAKDAPPVDPYFVPDANILAPIVTAMQRGNVNVWLHGPAGTGKTSYPMFIAAKTNRPFVRIAFNRSVEPIDLFGAEGLDGKGGMVWRDGALTKAIRRPGTIVLLDELTFAPPGSLAGLQTLLDHRFLTLTSGEVVKCAEGVFFIVADNTAGFGDMTGVYSGTQTMNAALNERFGRMVKVDYMSQAHETSALVNHTGLVKTAAARVVRFISDVRKMQAAQGSDSRPLSLRQLIAFVQMTQDGFDPETAFEMSALDRLPDAERQALKSLYTTNFDASAYWAELTGAPLPEAPSMSPEQVEARGAFEAVESQI